MINVFLHHQGKRLAVGRLLKQAQGTFFQYSQEFIQSGLAISPFHLPLDVKVYQAPKTPFQHLHGVFDG